ncbi:MAG: YceI family protein [Pseudomonadota bacterium]
MLKSALAFGFLAIAAMSTATVSANANEAAGTYKLDRAHASLVWKIKHLGLSFYTARFDTFDATLDIDPNEPESAKLEVTVDPKSIRTGFPFADAKDFDKELIESPNFFNAGEHPEIKFASTSIERTGDTTAKLTGDLTLLGVTKPVTLDITLNGQMSHPMKKKPALGFSGVGTIKRSEFGMTHLIGGVGDEVQLLLEAEFIKE